MQRTLRFALIPAALVAACTLALRAGTISSADAELQIQLANLLIEETRYPEALHAFEAAAQADDAAVALRARKGRVKTALRLAEFRMAHDVARSLANDAPKDPEALSLYADSLWSAGLFDESDAVYRDTLAIAPDSSRARYGLARSLSTRNRLDEALNEALTAVASAPRDGEIHHAIGTIYERLNRFDEAANAFTNYINLLPNKDRSDKAAWSRAQVKFLQAFEGKIPIDMDEEDREIGRASCRERV